jgi:outer membrane receptor protein involved in Fe transport
VGNVSTEANPFLAPESLTGADVGLDYESRGWRFSAGGFSSDLRDAVGNVTLSSTPALVSRQRLNLDRVRVRGLELSAGAGTDDGTWRASLSYLLSDSRVSEATVAPALVGRRFAQAPRHTATMQVTWRPQTMWRITAAGRAVSAQFDDDENTLRLASAVTADVAVVWTFSPGREVSVSAENLLDEKVETSRTRDGLVGVGPPRLARVGFAATW